MCGKEAQLLYPTEQTIPLLDHWTTTVITSLTARSQAGYIISPFNTPFRSPRDYNHFKEGRSVLRALTYVTGV